MADLISYRLTNADDPRLVSLVVNGVERRLLFSDSECESNQADWATYQAWLNNGNKAAAAPIPTIYPELTSEQKLSNIGLTVDSLKTVLGLTP